MQELACDMQFHLKVRFVLFPKVALLTQSTVRSGRGLPLCPLDPLSNFGVTYL